MCDQQPPETLYKYRSLDLNAIKHSMSIITQNRVYFARAEELNDPYEGFARVDTGSLRRIFPALGCEDCELEEAVRLDMRRKLRIFALSETSSSSTMWSHYADSHRGICIGFNTADMKNLEPVEYLSETPIIVGEDAESIYKSVALRKSIDWKYEREWRAVKFDPQQLVPLPIDAVSEVILGCEISKEHRMVVASDLMLRSIRHDPAKLYKAERGRNDYSIGRRLLGLADGRSAVDSAGSLDLEAIVGLSLDLLA